MIAENWKVIVEAKAKAKAKAKEIFEGVMPILYVIYQH